MDLGIIPISGISFIDRMQGYSYLGDNVHFQIVF